MPDSPGPRVSIRVAPANEPRPANFQALYELSSDHVWRRLRRLGVREADLEDAAQDVFLIAAGRPSCGTTHHLYCFEQ